MNSTAEDRRRKNERERGYPAGALFQRNLLRDFTEGPQGKRKQQVRAGNTVRAVLQEDPGGRSVLQGRRAPGLDVEGLPRERREARHRDRPRSFR